VAPSVMEIQLWHSHLSSDYLQSKPPRSPLSLESRLFPLPEDEAFAVVG
jgi:hypothetical protein